MPQVHNELALTAIKLKQKSGIRRIKTKVKSEGEGEDKENTIVRES